MTSEEALSFAWTHCAPQRSPDAFPQGFWPDVARVAMAMFEQQTPNPVLDFRPTKCELGNSPEVRVTTSKKIKGLDLSKLEITI